MIVCFSSTKKNTYQTGNQHFLLVPQFFSIILKNINNLFYVCSLCRLLFAFKLVKPQILSHGKEQKKNLGFLFSREELRPKAFKGQSESKMFFKNVNLKHVITQISRTNAKNLVITCLKIRNNVFKSRSIAKNLVIK